MLQRIELEVFKMINLDPIMIFELNTAPSYTRTRAHSLILVQPMSFRTLDVIKYSFVLCGVHWVHRPGG